MNKDNKDLLSYLSYKKDDHPLPGLDLSACSSRIQSIINWFESKNIDVSSTRILKYKKFLKHFVDHPDFCLTNKSEDRVLCDN
jgi:hypothetical protein